MSEILTRLTEAWGDIVRPDATFDGVEIDWAARRSQSFSKLRDRADGRYLPVYETELDLQAIRAAVRLLVERVPAAASIIAGLQNYTISSGFDWKVTHTSPRYQALCEAVVKAWANCAKWSEAQERESFHREVTEGEFIGEIVVDGCDINLQPWEGDNLTEPYNVRDLEDYLGICEPTTWSFGICRREGRWTPKYYHLIRNETATDFDCLSPDYLVHWTRNVPITAARGFSDFYLPYRYLLRADKVIDNTGLGASIQASIAYIREHVAGTTKTNVEAIVNGLKGARTGNDPESGRGYYTRQVQPGQVIDIPQGMKYYPGLLGQTNSQIYIEVMEALLRLCATRYHFPEHMITGYAGNNNLASSLVAESPFVQGRIADQAIREARLKSLFKSVIKAFCRSRWGRARGYCWDDVKYGLEIVITRPTIVSRDPVALTQALTSQIQAGLTSKRTAATELGRDHDSEQSNIAEESGVGPGSPPAAGTGEYADKSRLQFTRNQKGINEIVGKYATGALVRQHAEVALSMLGVSPENVAKLLDAVESNPAAGGMSESLTEALVESVVRQWKDYP